MGGLVLALVSLILGGLIYAIAYAARPAQVAATAGGGPALAGAGGGVFTGGEPLSSEGRLTAGDFSSIFLQNWHEFFRWSNVDLVYLGVWRGLQAASRVLGVAVSWMERRALVLVVVLEVAILAGVRWFAIGESNWGLPPLEVPKLLIAACAVAGLALLLAALAHSKSRRLVPLMTLAGIATVVGLVVQNHWLRLGLLELGAFITVALVWQSARTRSAKLTYLVVVVISALSLVASDLLLERGQYEWAWALFITSVCVKLAAVPLFFWLLSLADELPSVVLGLIIAVVDMAAFGEFLASARAIPDSYHSHAVLLGVAAATSLLAALLMLTQRSLKRLLVLSTAEDIGFLMLGVVSLQWIGSDGAVFAASTHALAKALLFICLSGPDADGALENGQTGLATRYPVAAFGFLFGMLAMLGIPPTMGFIGRWRLYETALQIGWPLAAIFILASIFALIAYTLALTRIWWGPARDGDSPPLPELPIREPYLLQGTIVVLVVLLLVAGLWPGALQMLHWGRP
jgi:formate hydrogenlyase subunit 3/multisubunit Na+/H+ antiporter MnhD subunit